MLSLFFLFKPNCCWKKFPLKITQQPNILCISVQEQEIELAKNESPNVLTL